jgi:hypothetical protein
MTAYLDPQRGLRGGFALRRDPGPCEASAIMSRPNFYAPGALDRASHLRKDETWIAARLVDAATRFVPVWKAQHLVVSAAEGPSAVLLRAEHAAPFLTPSAEPVFLGVEGGEARFALDLSPGEVPPLDRLATAITAGSTAAPTRTCCRSGRSRSRRPGRWSREAGLERRGG